VGNSASSHARGPVPLRCICLIGPTACGKSDLALGLAAALPVEIVSMDSAMVYRGMDIGTAKPPADVRAAVPHHLIDIRDPSEPYSAGRFALDAAEAIAAIHGRGRVPLLVGGTFLYLRALRDGLARLPRADAGLRAELDRQAAEHGWPALHRRLRGIDPAAAARVAPTDRQRIQRALEVFELTGVPLSELHKLPVRGRPADLRAIALVPADRAVLAERIERRFDAMVHAGLVSEVKHLKARPDLDSGMPSMRAVGYRQIWGHLEGAWDWAEARRRALAATRQLAKRQLTWLRSDQGCERWAAFEPDLGQRLLDSVGRQRAEWS
jgi:tRNA dimethylallyltransferase